jgi:hypothetical protein
MVSKFRPLLPLILAAAPLVASCTKPASESTVLQSSDLQTGESGVFDSNNIVDDASFTHSDGLSLTEVQGFLAHTPYKRSSFLETYQSNGISAAAAMISAAGKFGLNPLVFLVRLEMAQGLIGEQHYPSPPARVEYVFGCGCVGPGVCDPALAGLDKQIDCFARALRTSLDEITTNRKTSGGWGPGRAATTVDEQTVTPANASTAALYQYLPVVGVGNGSGNWLFWNIWQSYKAALSYSGPSGDDFGGWIGEACSDDAACYYDDAVCIQTALTPEGLCSLDCTNTPCPFSEFATTFCARVDDASGQHGYCLIECDPSAPLCRSGYSCVPNREKYGDSNTHAAVCFNN